jgi:ATP-dependent RNA helicase DOB1
LTVEQTVALMSCFCFQEKLDAAPAKLKEVLSAPLKMLKETARAIATVEVECNIPDVDVDVYVQKFKPDMMDVAFAWAKVSEVSYLFISFGFMCWGLIRVNCLRSHFHLYLALGRYV